MKKNLQKLLIALIIFPLFSCAMQACSGVEAAVKEHASCLDNLESHAEQSKGAVSINLNIDCMNVELNTSSFTSVVKAPESYSLVQYEPSNYAIFTVGKLANGLNVTRGSFKYVDRKNILPPVILNTQRFRI